MSADRDAFTTSAIAEIRLHAMLGFHAIYAASSQEEAEYVREAFRLALTPHELEHVTVEVLDLKEGLV